MRKGEKKERDHNQKGVKRAKELQHEQHIL